MKHATDMNGIHGDPGKFLYLISSERVFSHMFCKQLLANFKGNVKSDCSIRVF